MPWPLWPREMTFSATGILDRPNKAVLLVLKSEKEGDTFFGTPVPGVHKKFVHLTINRGYHYF